MARLLQGLRAGVQRVETARAVARDNGDSDDDCIPPGVGHAKAMLWAKRTGIDTQDAEFRKGGGDRGDEGDAGGV